MVTRWYISTYCIRVQSTISCVESLKECFQQRCWVIDLQLTSRALEILPNKAFKWDSCRVAFLVCSEFCGESGLRKVGLCGTHPLTRRYALIERDSRDR
ncbi:DUF3265 domain-containing protein [Vibrio vulnificus]|nr:DUF3265 domain-containing protein [Vibrio vulnificus]